MNQLPFDRLQPALITVAVIVAACGAQTAPSSFATGPASAVDIRVLGQRTLQLVHHQVLTAYGAEPLSPDGAWVVTTDGLARACLEDVMGAKPATCKELAGADMISSSFEWAPTGDRLTIGEAAGLGWESDVWVWDVNTDTLTDLTDDGLQGKIDPEKLPAEIVQLDVEPAWSPDRTELAFVRLSYPSDSDELVRIDAQGGQPQAIHIISPDAFVSGIGTLWRSDSIFYTVVGSGSDHNSGVYVVGLDGSGSRLLLGRDAEVGDPALVGASPDGRTILGEYDQAIPNLLDAPSIHPVPSHLFTTVDVQTGVSTPLTVSDSAAANQRAIFSAALSPDGSKIAYLVSDTPIWKNTELIVRDTVGGPENVLLRGTPDNELVGVQWPASNILYVDRARTSDPEGGAKASAPLVLTLAGD